MALVGIDVGHGSNTFPPDKGLYVDGIGYEEHDFNSKLCIELDKLLKANGIDTIMYQAPFSPEIKLTARTNYYNYRNVDLVWSNHANANSNKFVEGVCAFYWHEDKKAKELASNYAAEVRKSGYRTHGNGTHESLPSGWTNLHIPRESYRNGIPAILAENGFMTNNLPGIDDDFERIFGSKQEEYIKDLARIQAKVILDFFNNDFKDVNTGKIAEKKSNLKVEPEEVGYTGGSIVSYLNSVGIDSSFSHRARLAAAHGIRDYKGTSAQNTALLDKLRSEAAAVMKVKEKTAYEGNSIVDYLNTIGESTSFSNRQRLAKMHGIDDYKGTSSQNLELLNKMRSKAVAATKPKQEAYTGNSIVGYLKSIGADSSYSNRQKLAKQYGISNYKGTAEQNVELLEKMRSRAAAVTKPKGDMKTGSVVDYLRSINEDSSFSNRKRLAEKHGISNYKGTAEENKRLLDKLRG